MTTEACLVCGATVLVRLSGFAALQRVTSDVRPWRSGGELAVCSTCGAIQKPITEAWRREAAEVYADYALYHQTDDDDHPVIDPKTGAVEGRSSRLIKRVIGEVTLPAHGRMLEIGCGRGGLMRAFAALLPLWSVEGQDPHTLQASVRADDGRELPVHACAIAEVPGMFDLVVMNQVLEHIAGPERFWDEVRSKLAPSGRIVVQVPNIARNPFDLVVADHCMHFTPSTLTRALSRSGWHIEKLGEGWLNKELTAIAKLGAPNVVTEPFLATEPAAWVGATLEWLRATAEQARKLQHFGIFGTAIAALWLDGETAQRAAFFCDEEPRRAGNSLSGRPIILPDDLAEGACVFVALEPSVAALVVDRLASARVNFVSPPTLVRPGSP